MVAGGGGLFVIDQGIEKHAKRSPRQQGEVGCQHEHHVGIIQQVETSGDGRHRASSRHGLDRERHVRHRGRPGRPHHHQPVAHGARGRQHTIQQCATPHIEGELVDPVHAPAGPAGGHDSPEHIPTLG